MSVICALMITRFKVIPLSTKNLNNKSNKIISKQNNDYVVSYFIKLHFLLLFHLNTLFDTLTQNKIYKRHVGGRAYE